MLVTNKTKNTNHKPDWLEKEKLAPSVRVASRPTPEPTNINMNKNILMFIYIIITRPCAHTDRKSPDFNGVINEGTIGENACACVV